MCDLEHIFTEKLAEGFLLSFGVSQCDCWKHVCHLKTVTLQEKRKGKHIHDIQWWKFMDQSRGCVHIGETIFTVELGVHIICCVGVT